MEFRPSLVRLLVAVLARRLSATLRPQLRACHVQLRLGFEIRRGSSQQFVIEDRRRLSHDGCGSAPRIRPFDAFSHRDWPCLCVVAARLVCRGRPSTPVMTNTDFSHLHLTARPGEPPLGRAPNFWADDLLRRRRYFPLLTARPYGIKLGRTRTNPRGTAWRPYRSANRGTSQRAAGPGRAAGGRAGRSRPSHPTVRR
jgi:hypothetical protein